MDYKRIAVFCGSRKGGNPQFEMHAQELGYLLAENNIELIYGGGSRGLMGVVADAVMEKGGKVMGVIPEILVQWEAQHKNITDLRVVSDMHARKKMIYELCDAAVILPGGFGTLDEVFEMLTWNTLQIHDRKIYFLNSGGFYHHLVAHIRSMADEDFLYEDWQHRIAVVNEPADIFK